VKIRELIEAYLAASPEIRGTQRNTLERTGKLSIGAKDARKVTPHQIIEWAKELSVTCAPCTISAYVGYLRGAMDYAEVGLGLDGISGMAVYKAMPILKRQRLVGSGGKRTRIPTPEEHQRIIAHVGPGIVADVIAFQYEGGRRIGETCRLMWGDLNTDKKTIVVRDMKHSKMKTGNTKTLVVLDAAFDIIMRQKRMTNLPDERIFKVSARRVQAAHTRAVKALKIDDLHLHDSRARVVTKLLTEKYTVPQVMLVTGQATAGMVTGTYNRMQAEDFPRRAA